MSVETRRLLVSVETWPEPGYDQMAVADAIARILLQLGSIHVVAFAGDHQGRRDNVTQSLPEVERDLGRCGDMSEGSLGRASPEVKSGELRGICGLLESTSCSIHTTHQMVWSGMSGPLPMG